MATFSAMIVRCTAKARSLLGVRQLAEPEHSPDDWYLNLLWFDRRKCLLLAHVGTLFPVFVADVRKADLTPLDQWLTNVVLRELNAENLPAAVLGELAPPIVLAKTASRQTLGFMNEMAWFAECAIADAGGLARCDIAELNREQRRMLHNRDGRYVRPLDLVAERVGSD
ncbi:DUF6933 domain-containing protein [uncultured Jatrophihabitans sp.]|uniref:DUF6933 domain-containing protein n=1 Tax=uncultured Jatrophihabitans sp. TaxID=1610747 RepID=UPI0035CB8CD3